MEIEKYIEPFLILFVVFIIIFMALLFTIEAIYLKLNKKHHNILYSVLILSWVLLFAYSGYYSIKDGEIGKILIDFMLLMIITAPFGIIVFLLTGLIVTFLKIDSSEVISSIFFTFLFIYSYTQWFIWLPKYLKKKLEEQNKRKILEKDSTDSKLDLPIE